MHDMNMETNVFLKLIIALLKNFDIANLQLFSHYDRLAGKCYPYILIGVVHS